MQLKKDGLLLALDTSTTSMTAAVLQDGRLLNQLTSRAERNHSLYLIPAVQSILRELGKRPADLEAFAVGIGPGSYTGVRIGITVAKTMAWALGRPLLGVSSLEALALGALEEGAVQGSDKSGQLAVDRLVGDAHAAAAWIVPLLDARRGHAYTALFAAGAGAGEQGWKRLRPDGNRSVDEWTEELLRLLAGPPVEGTGCAPSRVVFVGEPERFEAQIGRFQAGWAGGRAEVLAYDLHAFEVGRLAWNRYRAGESDDLHGLVPNYTQLAEAEVKLLAKRG